MPNPENVMCQTPEQLRENGRKGGLKKHQNALDRKRWQDELSVILSLPISRADKSKASKEASKLLKVDSAKALKDFAGKNTTVQTQILLKLSQMAMSGNLKAIELIGTITGDNKQVIDLNANANVGIKSKVDTLADTWFGDDD